MSDVYEQADGVEELIYRPARRDKIGLIIGLSGPSWSGKTYSALRLARGMVGPTGIIGLLDTERGRGLTYAPPVGMEPGPGEFDFQHGPLNEPFTPNRYASAAAKSKQAGHGVLIIDSMSHEWAGPGGVLEMHEQELDRITKGSSDYAFRDAVTMTAWIKPKVEHKQMIQRLLQLNSHLILCFRAEEKTEIQLLKNKAGRLVNTPVNIGFQPITSKDMAFELTIMLGFDPRNPGVPIPIKLGEKFQQFVPIDRVLDESTGERLAAWARGEKPEPFASTPPAQSRPPVTNGAAKENKSKEVADSLIAAYQATKSTADHFALVDDPKKRDQVGWLKKNRPELFDAVNKAVTESYKRNTPQTATATTTTETPPAGDLGL